MRATMVCVDADGEPLRPAIVWLDQRRLEGVAPVGGARAASFRALGLSETIANFQANAESIWLARHQPEIWDRTHKFLYSVLSHPSLDRTFRRFGGRPGRLCAL